MDGKSSTSRGAIKSGTLAGIRWKIPAGFAFRVANFAKSTLWAMPMLTAEV